VGFDTRCARSGRFYGDGVYFAANASYTFADYAHQLEKGVRQFFLAHVLCGTEFDYGLRKDRGLKRPPAIPGTPGTLFDSVKVSF
jgi:hypothetical protein